MTKSFWQRSKLLNRFIHLIITYSRRLDGVENYIRKTISSLFHAKKDARVTRSYLFEIFLFVTPSHHGSNTMLLLMVDFVVVVVLRNNTCTTV